MESKIQLSTPSLVTYTRGFKYYISCGLNIPTSVWGFLEVVSVTILDKIVWSRFFGSGIQLTYVLGHDVVIALTSDIIVTGLLTV